MRRLSRRHASVTTRRWSAFIALETESELTPEHLSADLNDLADLADALYIVTDTKDDDHREHIIRAFVRMIMAFKMIQTAQSSWRRLDGHNQLSKLITGIKFAGGIEAGLAVTKIRA